MEIRNEIWEVKVVIGYIIKNDNGVITREEYIIEEPVKKYDASKVIISHINPCNPIIDILGKSR